MGDRWIIEEGGAVVDDITVLLAHFEEHTRIVTCEVAAAHGRTDGGLLVTCTGLGGEELAVIQTEPDVGVSWLRAALAERLDETPSRLRLVSELRDGLRVFEDGESLADMQPSVVAPVAVIRDGTEAACPCAEPSDLGFDSTAGALVADLPVDSASGEVPTMQPVAAAPDPAFETSEIGAGSNGSQIPQPSAEPLDDIAKTTE